MWRWIISQPPGSLADFRGLPLLPVQPGQRVLPLYDRQYTTSLVVDAEFGRSRDGSAVLSALQLLGCSLVDTTNFQVWCYKIVPTSAGLRIAPGCCLYFAKPFPLFCWPALPGFANGHFKITCVKLCMLHLLLHVQVPFTNLLSAGYALPLTGKFFWPSKIIILTLFVLAILTWLTIR